MTLDNSDYLPGKVLEHITKHNHSLLFPNAKVFSHTNHSILVVYSFLGIYIFECRNKHGFVHGISVVLILLDAFDIWHQTFRAPYTTPGRSNTRHHYSLCIGHPFSDCHSRQLFALCPRIDMLQNLERSSKYIHRPICELLSLRLHGKQRF